MYICINCSNIFSVDSREIDARARTRVDLNPGPENPKIVESSILGASFSWAITLLGVKSSSNSPKTIKLCNELFWWVAILE